ncbi:MAG: S-layer homology domain-containing protein [Firmicutes bacterium]|nr:S-layer homology domain-containing protein [Bacillota bacterium]
MKRRIIATILTLLMALSLFPAAAWAAQEPAEADLKTAPVISNLEIHDDGEGFVWLEVTVQTPANVLNAIDYFENHELGFNQAGYIGQIDLQYSVDGGEWQETAVAPSPNYDHEDPWNGVFETQYMDELRVDSEVKARARYSGAYADGSPRYSDWSNMLVLNEKVDFTASQWALPELAEADRLGLIPDCLKGQDLTKKITRAEFAAVSVKVFEALANAKAEPAAENPFRDTADPEVLKAFNVGITDGKNSAGDLFGPDDLLTREQAATMLTRVWKKVNFSGWTLKTDGEFDAQFKKAYTMPARFSDDEKISSWAYDSVYFMAANHIVEGSNGAFSPRAVTDAEKAMGYAQATREQALAIAVRMAKNL